MLAIEAPFPLYFDAAGSPLDAGYLYFGVANQNPETNPITVYWDLAATQPAAQPIRTINGFAARSGSPAVVYVAGDYSLTVRDSVGRLLPSSGSSANVANSASILAVVNNFIANLASTNGPNLMTINPTLNYAVGTIGCHAGVEWNPQDYPWLAKFDGVTDDTAAIQACLTAVYNAGGGVMRLPAKTARITALSLNFAASRSVVIRGCGEQVSVLKQIGGGSTPMLSLSAATNVLDVYSELADFDLDGVGKTAHGVVATTIASMVTRNLGIGSCDTAWNSLGCLVTTHHTPRFGTYANNRGFACAASSGIYPNLVNVFGGKINSNTVWNVDITHGSNIAFYGTDLSGGGTSGNLSTGCVNTATTIAAESGLALLKFDNCWLEVGLGQPVRIQDSAGLHASFLNTMHASSEGGRMMNVGAIGSVTIINPIGAGASDTITIGAAGASLIVGGVATTIVDSSVQQMRINSAGSLATPGTKIKNLQIAASGTLRLDPTAKISDTGGSFTQGNPIVTFQDGAGAGGSVVLYAANGGGGNAAASVLKLTSNSSTSRSINVGGTINASGADYAEYETKRDDCGVLVKGQVVGFDAAGMLTDRFSLAVSFGVKSTSPSIVGGDTWSPGDPPEMPREPAAPPAPIPAGEKSDDETKAAYAEALATFEGAQAEYTTALAEYVQAQAAYPAALAAFEAELESARAKVDRIAYAGKVPVNVLGARPGQFILAADDGAGGIKGVASDTDGPPCVGKVRTILPDGRAQLVVRAA